MQFMEDTLDTTNTFKVDGKKKYLVFKEEGEFET